MVESGEQRTEKAAGDAVMVVDTLVQQGIPEVGEGELEDVSEDG